MKHIAIIFFFISCTNAFSQERFNVTLGTGLGKFKMDDLKELQDWQEDWFGDYELERVNNFPMYFYYSGEISARVHRIISVGLIYRLQSTGCKSSYSDYSGVIRIEQVVKSNNAGLILDVGIWNKNKFSLSGQTRVYYGWTDLKNTQYFKIYSIDNDLLNNTSKIKSQSIMLNPDLTVSYEVWDNLFINLSAGYCFDFRGDMKFNSNNQPVYNLNGEVAQTDWSGMRLGLSASYRF